MPEFLNNAIFWIETEKIHPNPYQPRKDFDEHHLRDLADSIRQYGVLQPLVVTRKEVPRSDETGIDVEYELIAGERRLRASRLAGLARVPAIIQSGVQDARIKLEMAIIENLQREDLSPVDRALAFRRLADEFGFKHTEIAQKMGKSREYVSNTMRLLDLPEDILNALGAGKITEGHARTLMMLTDRKEEQNTLFREVLVKRLTVRETEQIARHIAKDKLRKKVPMDSETARVEKALADRLGTRVQIEKREVGGKVVIDYFSIEDLEAILAKVSASRGFAMPTIARAAGASAAAVPIAAALPVSPVRPVEPVVAVAPSVEPVAPVVTSPSFVAPVVPVTPSPVSTPAVSPLLAAIEHAREHPKENTEDLFVAPQHEEPVASFAVNALPAAPVYPEIAPVQEPAVAVPETVLPRARSEMSLAELLASLPRASEAPHEMPEDDSSRDERVVSSYSAAAVAPAPVAQDLPLDDEDDDDLYAVRNFSL